MRKSLYLLVLTLAGCAGTPSSPLGSVALLGPQLQKQDAELIGQKFRTMLDFETDADAAFVRGTAGYAPGHTGQRAVAALPGASINITSLLFGLTLPADWSLLGTYVRPTVSGVVTTTLLADGQPIAVSTRNVPADAWAFAAVDLTTDACRKSLPGAKSISLRIDSPGGYAIDDVMLVDNRRTLVQVDGGWTVSNAGLFIDFHWPDRPPLRVESSAASPDGWSVAEANSIRVRLQDATGRPRWILLADGRAIFDGKLRSTDPEALSAYALPARATVDESTGHLDRETAGDADNDGFNEQRGAYQITATGPRLRMHLTPQSNVVTISPMLEIRGLPAEAKIVTVDGRLVTQTVRLDDGTLLVLLPLWITSPVEVNVGVGQP
ncbi:MAG: hypothetical protein JWM57_3528 [Phycisphaerales bacterium]|nr:hypothetical protein [Phycisphaerales bacterium]